MKKYFIIVFLLSFASSILAQNSATSTTSSTNTNSTEVYKAKDVDEAPFFKGGDRGLHKYINSYIEIPSECRKYNGEAVVSFIVDEYGKTTNFKILKSTGKEKLDNAIIEVLKKMPNWTPGMKDNKKVKTLMEIPIKIGNTKTTSKELNKKINTNQKI